VAISQQLPGPWAASTAPELAFGRAFDPTYIRAFSDILSAVGMYDLGFRPSGTEAGHRAGELIAEEMRRIGLSDMRREPFPVYAWGFRGARIELHGPARRTIPASSYPPTPGTPPEGLTGVLVDAGLGTAADYVGREVKGKIVFRPSRCGRVTLERGSSIRSGAARCHRRRVLLPQRLCPTPFG